MIFCKNLGLGALKFMQQSKMTLQNVSDGYLNHCDIKTDIKTNVA